MVKSHCSDKLPMQKGLWNEDEDENMLTYASKHGKGVRKSGKCSKQRWNNNNNNNNNNNDKKLSVDPRHKNFTPQEEELVIKLHAAIGSRWPIIAQQLPGRSDNDVKILWNSKLRKKLSAMGIDPVTHRPFSQILADYGNIGAFPRARTRFSSLSRDLKNVVMLNNSEQFHNHPQSFPNYDDHKKNSFSTGNVQVPKIELSDDNNSSFDLYSQLQAINLVTEASNYTNTENMAPHFMNECASSSSSMVNQEISSFSWSDFLLEETLNVKEQDNMGMFVQCDGNTQGKNCFGAIEDENGGILVKNSFEESTSSNSSFVEAMIERQDEMFSQFPDFYEESFYY